MRSQRPLETRFFAGAHKEVLLATVDSGSGEWEDEDTAIVIGALVFAGRADEAFTIFRSWERSGNASKGELAAASRFFLCIAECRAGRYAAAEKLCRLTLSELTPESSSLERFYLHQGLGLVRHFTGRIGRAALHAARARRHALEARFPYGRMLALDLLGHARLHRGDVLSGLTLLEQAADLADAIGLAGFAMMTRSAVVANRARFGVGDPNPVVGIEEHLERLGDTDRYSTRVLLTELAEAHALRGDPIAARNALRRAEELALPDGGRRVAVKLHLARAVVDGLAEGEAAAAQWLALAEPHVDFETDPALAVEIAWYEYLVCPSRFERRASDWLAKVARDTNIFRAALLASAKGADAVVDAAEDRFAALVVAIRHREAGIDNVLASEKVGLLPLVVGRPPAMRLWLDASRGLFAIEDRGSIASLEVPSDALIGLLRALAGGTRSKEDLIRDVWRLNVYRPEKHDAVVHTAISRLRTALGPRGAWVQASGGGYALASDVELLELTTTGASLPSKRTGTENEARAADPRRELVLELVRRPNGAATREVAQKLNVSEMTALRWLAGLVDEGLIQRTGRGRNTRYTAPI